MYYFLYYLYYSNFFYSYPISPFFASFLLHLSFHLFFFHLHLYFYCYLCFYFFLLSTSTTVFTANSLQFSSIVSSSCFCISTITSNFYNFYFCNFLYMYCRFFNLLLLFPFHFIFFYRFNFFCCLYSSHDLFFLLL